MSATLDENLNIVSESGLEIALMDDDLVIIQKLDDEPNDVGGMTSAELKATFDTAGLLIQKYINEKLVPAILDDDATAAARAAAEAGRVASEESRVAAETARVNAETARSVAEAARVVWAKYDSTEAYIPGNKVAYNGSSYVNVKSCTGVAPTDATYWLLIAAKGESIVSIERTSGDGSSGSVDTYTVTLTSGDTHTYSVYNGKDGKDGAGDMTAAVYDPQGRAGDIFAELDKKAVTGTYTATVDTTWVEDATNGGYTQTVAVAGILSTDNPIADVVLGADADANEAYLEAWGKVNRIVTAGDSVTLYATDVPETAFNIQLKVVR